MAQNSQVNVGIKFRSDTKEVENSLNKLKKSLQDLQSVKPMNFKGTRDELEDLKRDLKEVEQALSIAFNPKLNTVNLNSFYQKLNESGISVNKLSQDMAKMGPSGNAAFNRLASQVLNTNLKLKQTHSLLDSMGKTMVNTVKWGVASSVMNTFTQSVQGAFQYVQSLEKSLTNIRIVTGDSTEKMAQFAEQANKSAQALGRSTLDYTKASLTYYQQGLNAEDVQARTEATLKAQNITGAGSQMADYLTSVWNGYKVANEEAELYVDKLAAVADSSASDMSQLAIAMSKVASTASTMGVDVDQLNAQIATVVATTRQAPESVGTAFKTIYTRMNDIKTGSEEAEVSLGRYSGIMAELGFNVLDATGNLRDTGQVMEEIGGRWQELTKEQQIYLAQTMGGQRQVNQLMALFDNWTTYSDLLNTSLESEGTLAEKNTRYIESLGAKMEQLGAAGERVKAGLIDENEIKGVVDVLTQATNLLGIFIEGLGGGSNALLTLGSIATSVFSDSIAKEINNIIINFQNADDRLKKLQQQKANTQKWVSEISPQLSSEAQSKVIRDILKDKQEIESLYKVMSNQEINTYNALLKEKAEHNIIKTELEEKKKVSDDILDGIQKQTKALKDQLQSQGQLSEESKNFLKNFGDPDELQASLGELKSKVEETFQTISSMKINPNAPIEESIAQLKKPLDQFLNSQGEMGKILENTTGYTQLQIQLSQTGITADTAKQAMLRFLNSSADGIENLDTQKYRELTTEIDKQAAKYREAENARREYFQGIKQLSQVKVFVQMAAGVAQVASGIRTLWNLQKTWKDDSISTGEKIIQILTSGTMALTQLYTGFQKVGTGLSTLILKWKTMALTSAGVTAQQITQQKLLQVTYAETAKAAWESLGPYLPLALAVAAAVGLIVAAYKEWNREADAAKKANEIAADAKKTYDDLKTSLDNVKSVLDDLHSAEDNLDGLTKGTQEWRDALQQCNDKVLELISNYPELAQYVTNENGQLKLSAEGEQAYLDSLQAGVQNARNASYIASSNSREADATAAAADIGHNSIYSYDNQGGATYASSNQVLKVTQAIDKVVGEGTSLKDGLSGLTEKISAQTGISEEIVGTILQNEDAVLQLKAQLEQNATADKMMYEAMAANSLQDNNTYKGMDQYGKQVANAIAGADLDAAVKESEDKWMGIMQNQMSRFTTGSTGIVQNVLQALNNAQGTNWRMDSNAVRGGRNDRTLAFLDEQGQLHQFTAQQIASTIAAKEALQNLGTSAETAAQMLKHIDTSGISGSAQEAVKQWISGQDMSATTRAGLEELKGQDIQNLLGSQGAQALAEQWNLLKEDGTADIEALNERWHSSCDDMSNAFDNVAKDASNTVQTAFNSLRNNDNVKQASLGAQQEMVSAMQEAFNKNGKAGLDQLLNVYNSLKDAKPEDGISALDGFSKVIKDFDFNTGSVEDFKNALKEAGVETNASTQAIQAYINAQKQASELSPEQNYKSVHGITDNLKRNDTIDAEQAATLEAAGVNLKTFFTLTADGSYKLKANAETFQQYINGITIQPFKAKMDQLQNKINSIHSFGEGGQFEKYSSQNMGIDEFSAVAGNKISDSSDAYSIDENKLQAQVEFLKIIGEQDASIQQAEKAINEGRTLGATDLQRISELIRNHSEQYQNLSELEKQYLQDMLDTQQQIADASDRGLDEDVDEEKRENLSEHLQEYADQIPEVSDELKDNADAADDLAQAMLRYDSAIGQVKDNYDDWLKALSSDSIEDQIEATEDLENVYSDLLDLPFDNILSQDFLQNVDNLNLLKQAANGSEQAYRELQETAAQDILAQVGLDDSQFYIDKDAIEQSLYQLTGQEWDDIEIGASLNDEAFLNELTNMVNAAGMTAEQATDYLASMGVDAEVIEHDTTATENQTAIGYRPVETGPQTFTDTVSYFGPDGQIQTGQVHYAATGYSYEAIPIENQAEKQNKSFSLEVKSAKKSSGGGFKYKNSSAGNKGGGGSSKGGGGKGRKGGGGGKGSQPKQPNKAKGASKEADRYHDNTVRANKLAKNLDKLNKQQEKLNGKDSLKNLEKQLKLIEKQKGNIQERLILEENQQNELKASLALYGAQFNKDGTIKNYESTFDKIIGTYNKAVAKWNKMSAEEQEKNKDFLENQKQQMDKALSNLDRYDKVLNELADYRQKLIDKAQEQIDIKVKEFDIKVQAKLDFAEARRDWNEFKKEIQYDIRDDDFLGQNNWAFQDLTSYYNNQGTGTVQFFSNQLQDLVTEGQRLFSQTYYNIYGQAQTVTDRAAYLEKLKETSQNLKQQMQGWRQTVDKIKESIFDAIDAAQDAFDQQMREYEYIGDIVNHNMKVTQMLFGDEAYAQMDKFYDRIEKNNNQQLNFLTQQKDMWYGRMMEQEARMQQLARANNANSNIYKEAQDRFEEYKKHWMDSVKDLNSTVEDALDNIMDKYNNSINQILVNFDLKLGNGRALEDIQDEWDAINEKTDTFLDKINSAYEIDKLRNAFQDAIDDNDGNIAAQKSLNGLMEQQLAYLKDKEKLTQYDVDRANTLLQIEIKRLALEQTRANKNRLRLRRDSQGNYTYQYTANQEEVNKSQQELADLQNSLYNSDKAAYVDNLNAIKKSADNIKQQLEDIWTDENLSKKEKLEKSYELEKRYGTLMNDLLAENTSIRNNLIQSSLDELVKLYGYSEEKLNAMSSEEKNKLMKDLVPQAGSLLSGSVQAMITQGGIGDYMTQAINKFLEAQDQKVKDIAKLEESGQINFKDIINDQNVVLQQAEKLLDDNEKLINSYDDEIAKIQGTINAVNKMDEAYKNFFNTVQQGEKYSPLEAITKAFQTEQKEDIKTNGGTQANVQNQYLEGKTGYENAIKTSNNSYNDLVNYKPYQSQWSGSSAAAMFGSTSVPQDYLNKVKGSYQNLLNQNNTLNEKFSILTTPTVTTDFTKPLVVSGTTILENLIKTTNSKIDAINENLTSMIKQDGNYQNRMLSTTETIKNLINQSISIAADFPNAKDVKTIIDAIESLSNIAAQKATTNNKI